ncbi:MULTISPECIES: flagellar basal body-associated FliL family protein [Rhizobium]|uniref:Flagellar protein FliL n=1 Tax=Rhizobium bangladeshense TaxID=1138189 RepID=A0ABS7LE62_9HYPH|nr:MULTISPECIES: flagellar basal body-associated FliL family protein [Rhizobium]MBX4865702.1 flagellar basal body protein FliL [Rhizobium bangladeshense]MBX4872410.1 flagellar basal body protein FliL [Rhizobium bangladeshense]MBX4882284.1 flagellar basal body protein FliL [Rhizobium bangladeshense]MBX4892789.1 flagellar basal body protein FliL [Rhizobium bangladeshense]MBX4898421.1 flagellar basal body protein FliL [Rhizobium bangladeshense]
MADEDEGAGHSKKKSGSLMTIIGVVVLTLLGAGGGWAVGTIVAPNIKGAKDAELAKEAEAKKKAEEGLARISTEENNVVQLEPITSNLAYPSENWVRLEVALLFNGPPDVKVSEDIHQDILAYVRTVSLQQIEGPRGFQYLKDDIQERVDLRSQGRVSKVMFRTFVIE